MKNKKKKYLPLYEKWMESGYLTGGHGLCFEFNTYACGMMELDGTGYWEDELFAIMSPTIHDYKNVYWGGYNSDFHPLRQTVVLFMAAMNNEL